MSRHRFWKNALVNRRPVRHTTPLRVERLEARDLPAAPVPADIVSWYRAEGDASDFVGGNQRDAGERGDVHGRQGWARRSCSTASMITSVFSTTPVWSRAAISPSRPGSIPATIRARPANRREARGQRQRLHVRDHARALWPQRRVAIRRVDRRRATELPADAGRCHAEQHLAACRGNLRRLDASDLRRMAFNRPNRRSRGRSTMSLRPR